MAGRWTPATQPHRAGTGTALEAWRPLGTRTHTCRLRMEGTLPLAQTCDSGSFMGPRAQGTTADLTLQLGAEAPRKQGREEGTHLGWLRGPCTVPFPGRKASVRGGGGGAGAHCLDHPSLFAQTVLMCTVDVLPRHLPGRGSPPILQMRKLKHSLTLPLSPPALLSLEDRVGGLE